MNRFHVAVNPVHLVERAAQALLAISVVCGIYFALYQVLFVLAPSGQLLTI
jgi:hypothetical protein